MCKVVSFSNKFRTVNFSTFPFCSIYRRIFIKTFPHEQYINDVEYTIVGEGIILDGSSVDTSAATCNEFSVTVSLTAQGKTFVQTRDYILYDKITEIVVSDTVETIMNAGYSYRLKAEVYPFTANQDVTWKLSSSYKGISISKDVVSIDEDCLVNSFSLFAYSGTIKSHVGWHSDVNRGASVFYGVHYSN